MEIDKIASQYRCSIAISSYFILVDRFFSSELRNERNTDGNRISGIYSLWVKERYVVFLNRLKYR